MAYFEFPHTRTYDNDLGWLICHVKHMSEQLNNFINFNTIKYANPIAWNITTQYEANTVVINPADGTAYISTRPVPSGVLITNTDYWTPIFNYGESLDNIKEQIAASNEESSATATRAYSAGDLLWRGNTLFRAITDFPAGTAFIEGVNIEHVTVEELLDALHFEVSTNTTAIADIKRAIVTPEMFGAVGDGVADDTAAIRAALASGAIVRMNGRYNITSQIAIPNNSHICGYGTIIDNVPAASSGDGVATWGALLIYNVHHVRIEGITIEGGGALNHYSLKVAILAYMAESVVIDGVTVNNYPGLSAILARSCNYVTVNSCHIKDYTYGGIMFVEGTSYSRVTRCNVIDGHERQHGNRYPIMICGYQENYEGLTAPQGYMIECAYNYVYDTQPWWEGIDAHGGEYLFVHHNRMINVAGGLAIFTSESRGFTARYCWIYDNGVYNTNENIGNAGSRYGSSFGGNNMFIYNNTFRYGGFSYPEAGSAGVYINQGMPLIFEGNRVYNSYATSVLLAGSYNHAILRDNSFSGVTAHDSVSYGVRFYDSMGTVYSVTLDNNEFEGAMTCHVRGPRNKTIASQFVDLIRNTYLSGNPQFENIAYLSPDKATPAQIAQTTHGDNGKFCTNVSHTADPSSPYGWYMRNSTTHTGTWEADFPAGNTYMGPGLTYSFTSGAIGYEEALDPVTVPDAPDGFALVGFVCDAGTARIANPVYTSKGVLSWYNRAADVAASIIIFPMYRRVNS